MPFSILSPFDRASDEDFLRALDGSTASWREYWNKSGVELDDEFDFSFNTKALDVATGRRRQEFVEMMGMLNEIAQSPMAQSQGVYLDVQEAARILLNEFDRESSMDRLVKRVQGGQLPQAPEQGPFKTPGNPGVPGAAMAPKVSPW